MTQLMRFSGAVRASPEVEAWFAGGEGGTRLVVRPWFERMRSLGPDVRELIHDGWPTACVEDAAFAYVAAFKAHASIGFYQGASLADPAGLLEGEGRRMRHVKLRWAEPVDEAALEALLAAAYRDMRQRLADEAGR